MNHIPPDAGVQPVEVFDAMPIHHQVRTSHENILDVLQALSRLGTRPTAEPTQAHTYTEEEMTQIEDAAFERGREAAAKSGSAGECQHETTHRGGAIWTICDDCGKKWADDEGGFKPYEPAPEIAAAEAAISARPGVGESSQGDSMNLPQDAGVQPSDAYVRQVLAASPVHVSEAPAAPGADGSLPDALERAVEACEDVEEPAWYGYENPNTFDDGKRACIAAIRALAATAPLVHVSEAPAQTEAAPAHNLPDWSECARLVENAEFRKRAVAGLEGPVLVTVDHSPEPTELHRFIHEYDDADPFRSAWFLHRLELVVNEAKSLSTPPTPEAAQTERQEFECESCWRTVTVKGPCPTGECCLGETRWKSIEHAHADPLFQQCRGIMGTTNEGQDRALFNALQHFELRAAPKSENPSHSPEAEPAKWIDDPHDIEQGQMLNPEWLKFHRLTVAEARAAHNNAGARLSPDLLAEPGQGDGYDGATTHPEFGRIPAEPVQQDTKEQS